MIEIILIRKDGSRSFKQLASNKMISGEKRSERAVPFEDIEQRFDFEEERSRFQRDRENRFPKKGQWARKRNRGQKPRARLLRAA